MKAFSKRVRSAGDFGNNRIAYRSLITVIAVLFWLAPSVLTPSSVLRTSVLYAAQVSDTNLLENPGFEKGSDKTVDVWGFYGDITWTNQEVHSGKRAMRIAADNSSSSIQSSWFQAPAHSRLEVGAWLKADNVVSGGSYYKLRVTLQAYAADKETRSATGISLHSTARLIGS